MRYPITLHKKIWETVETKRRCVGKYFILDIERTAPNMTILVKMLFEAEGRPERRGRDGPHIHERWELCLIATKAPVRPGKTS